MADPRINVLTLGLGGVDVDSDPLLTADNATLKSQNATYDPTLARGGGLAKRPGLDRFNTQWLSGAVLGGIEAPFAGTAGAPLSGGGGGGLPGDPGGTNDGQPIPPAGGYGVGPGSTLTVGTAASTGPVGAGGAIFTSGSALFGGGKLIVIGRTDNLSTYGSGWYVTSKGFNNIAQLLTGPGPPMNGATLARIAGGAQGGNVGQTANHDQVIGFPQSLTEGLCARPNGILFYAGVINPSLHTTPAAIILPTIRRNDGTSDVQVAAIPVNDGWPVTGGTFNSGATHSMAIVGMGTRYADAATVYVVVHDRTGGSESTVGDGCRIFSLDTGSHALAEIFNSLNTNYNTVVGAAYPFLSGGGIPAWFGGVQQSTTGQGFVYSLVASSASADSYANWTGYEGAYADKSDVSCMAIYNGDLYIGHSNQAASAAFAKINLHPITGNNLAGNPVLTATGGSATAGNLFPSMAIFKGALYVSYYNSTQIAKIYKFDGTSWTTAYTSGTYSADLVPMNLQIDGDGDILYAFGCVDSTTPAFFMTSTDGVSWANKSGNLTGNLTGSGGGDFSNSFPMNVFADFNQ